MELEERVDAIEKDLYRGNGRLPLTVRMSLQEELTKTISTNFSRLVWLVLGTFVAVLGDIIAKGFHLI